MGFGTDAHALRVVVVVALLFVCGLVVVWPNGKTVRRVPVALLGLASAAAAWWFVPASPDGHALHDAASERTKLEQQFASPLLEDLPSGLRAKVSLEMLEAQYPSLTVGLRDQYMAWLGVAEKTLTEKFQQLALDDIPTAQSLNTRAYLVGELDANTATRLETAFREWLTLAVRTKTEELAKLPRGEWAEFDRTAPGRQMLAAAFPSRYPALVRAEREWVDSSVEHLISNHSKPKPDPIPFRQGFWIQTHTDILALKSLDRTGNRFAKTRIRLFTVAHAVAQREVAAHLEAGAYDLAFGVARKHSVEWQAAATLLGPEELKKLDTLRAACAFFDTLFEKAAKPPEAAEIAPPPRTKP